jgi:hypothetical protein
MKTYYRELYSKCQGQIQDIQNECRCPRALSTYETGEEAMQEVLLTVYIVRPIQQALLRQRKIDGLGSKILRQWGRESLDMQN